MLEDDDFLATEPGWHRIVDLARARSKGLVQSARIREGGTWKDMFDTLDRVVAPLVASG